MSRVPFGDPPLSHRVIGFIALAVGTDGDRSSIGSTTFPRVGP